MLRLIDVTVLPFTPISLCGLYIKYYKKQNFYIFNVNLFSGKTHINCFINIDVSLRDTILKNIQN